MADNDRPLPTPPRRGFGPPRSGPDESAGPSTADRMMHAAAEGRLEEFLQYELPGDEHARELARMMLSMTGMSPAETGAAFPRAAAAGTPASGPAPAPEGTDASCPPEVMSAVRQGDIKGLASLLRTEHERRSGGRPGCPGSPPQEVPAPEPPAAPDSGRPGIDAALVEELVRIGASNDVSVDWLMLRAVKLYVEEYRRSGRL